MYRIVFWVFILISGSVCSFGQQKTDSVAVKQSKSVITSNVKPTSIRAIPDSNRVANASTTAVDTTPFMTPKKIGLLSAILPGFGQFKNKQYWKVGVIAVGAGAAAYFIYDNQKGYNDGRTEQATRKSHEPSKFTKYNNYTDQNLSDEVEYYQKNLDLTYVLTGVGYALQIIDAVVFAHLKGFDISEDISLKWKPIVTPQGGPGFGLVMKF